MSKQINNGGPAGVDELSLRDWFAGQALSQIAHYAMADGWIESGPHWRDAVAYEAYKFADAMIAARKETEA